MKKAKTTQIVFTPQFQKEFNEKVPPDERDALLKEILEFTEKLKENPYIGTPMWGGPFRQFVILWNWVKRTLWGWGVRW